MFGGRAQFSFYIKKYVRVVYILGFGKFIIRDNKNIGFSSLSGKFFEDFKCPGVQNGLKRTASRP